MTVPWRPDDDFASGNFFQGYVRLRLMKRFLPNGAELSG